MSLPNYITVQPLLLLSVLPGLVLAQEQGFIEGATANVLMRNFYFNRDFATAVPPRPRARSGRRAFCLTHSPATPKAPWVSASI